MVYTSYFECNDCSQLFSTISSLKDIRYCPRCKSKNIEILGTNDFLGYTDKLAATLEAKNQAYGDSFTKSVDEDGLLVLKIRLGDKFNRISELIKNRKLKENDESLEDTLLDTAGYAILGLKYLEEHDEKD